MDDLFSVAKTSKQFTHLAANVLRRKYPKRKVQIGIPKSQGYKDHLIGQVAYLEGVPTILKYLRYFGSTIPSLEVRYTSADGDSNVLSTLNEYINVHCADTLMEIEILHGQFFQNVVKPFKLTENVILHGQFETFENSILTFDQIFPALKRLSLRRIKVSDKSAFYRSFPQLHHLDVYIANGNELDNTVLGPLRFTESDLIKMLEQNPQIQSLIVQGISRSSLRLVNELLPNLENLEIIAASGAINPDDNREIVFAHVKTFKVSTSSPTVYENLHFPSLVDFKADKHGLDWWLCFVGKQDNLQKFTANDGCFNTTDFNKLASSKLNTLEISVQLCEDVVIDRPDFIQNVTHFVKNHGHMKDIYFYRRVPKDPTKLVEALRKTFEQDWTVLKIIGGVHLKHL